MKSYQLTSCGYQPDTEDKGYLEAALKNLKYFDKNFEPSEDEILETMRDLANFSGMTDPDAWISKLSIVIY